VAAEPQTDHVELETGALTVDKAFIRRAVELADLNAVRVTLSQHTRDPSIELLPLADSLTEAQRDDLIDKAVTWLSDHSGPESMSPPTEEELRRLLGLAKGRDLTDDEYLAWQPIPAFEDYPVFARWNEPRPEMPENFRAAVIGAGFAGLAIGVQLGLLDIPYVVFERQAEPGGTWTRHRYPGIGVDTASITYEFAFEKNYPWSEYFGHGPEVRRYIDYVSKKYNVQQNCRFGCDVRSATFDERRNIWVLDIATPDGTERFEANVLIAATGTFANPKIPRFEGQDIYEGQVIHPSEWPHNWEASRRRIAVIGNGSTGVQLLAPIAKDAEQVFVFQRTAQWISPRPRYGKPIEPEMRWLYDNFSGYWNWARVTATAAADLQAYLIPDPDWIQQGGRFSRVNDKMREDLIAYIEQQTAGREDLIERLVPTVPPFSRRFVVDNGWYRALTQDNVELVTDAIERLTAKGIETADGSVREVDTIVTATGFEVARYLLPARFTGRGGVDLHDDVWSFDGPRAYLGMMVPQFPNMFMLYGPNSQPTSGGGGLHHWWVLWSAYAARCIIRMLQERKETVEVTTEAYWRYNQALDKEAVKLLYVRPEGDPEKNYYVNSFGRLQVNSPWPGVQFNRLCSEINWNDLVVA
jgi:4-hydroxyacetophenone monooxygenase